MGLQPLKQPQPFCCPCSSAASLHRVCRGRDQVQTRVKPGISPSLWPSKTHELCAFMILRLGLCPQSKYWSLLTMATDWVNSSFPTIKIEGRKVTIPPLVANSEHRPMEQEFTPHNYNTGQWNGESHSFNQRPIEQGVPLYKFGSTDSGTMNLGITITQQFIQYTYTYACITTRPKTEKQVMYLFRFCLYEIRIVTVNSNCSVVVVNDSII